jgi:hypothetical protein
MTARMTLAMCFDEIPQGKIDQQYIYIKQSLHMRRMDCNLALMIKVVTINLFDHF